MATTTDKKPNATDAQQLADAIARVIEGVETPPELLDWASDVDTKFVLQVVAWISEKSDFVAEDCRSFLRLIEFIEAHGIERVKKSLVVAEYVAGDLR